MLNVSFLEKDGIFILENDKITYMMALTDPEGYLSHVYFGPAVPDRDLRYVLRLTEPPFTPSKNNRDRLSFYDSHPFEYPTCGLGDFREPCLIPLDENGRSAFHPTYRSHRILTGKPALAGLPSTFEGREAGKKGMTLQITMEDRPTGLLLELSYSIFEDASAVVRSCRLLNETPGKIHLQRAYSFCLDLDGRDFDVVSLSGAWARERHVDRTPLPKGKFEIQSFRGESSHQANPFLALAERGADEDRGEVYGFSLIYSGNFALSAEGSQFDQTRVCGGICDKGFDWLLEPKEAFQAPEVMMVYSREGLGGMSRSFHDLIREHLIRSPYLHEKRPILINNWEATYFDFDSDKLYAIAEKAADLGIEMLVMDDGWFGHRNGDNSSLGDWTVNLEKITGGLDALSHRIHGLKVRDVTGSGVDRRMKFGIWFEPEMISPDSDLYRAHSDWAIRIPGREPGLGREQLVLDLSRPEVEAYAYEAVASILRSARIDYVKWDMNRQLSDLGSGYLPRERQGELSHRYVLALYRMQEQLVTEFPDLLLENCSGGGARFDPGMLYYSPQIWCSDDTDAVERLAIQRGTSLVYPLGCMGAHVSACPNHAVGRTTPFATRACVALAGTFGYELDVTKIPEEDRAQIPAQVSLYHRYNDLIREGDYYQLADFDNNGRYDSWMVCTKDRTEALVTLVQVLAGPNRHSLRLKLKGLDPKRFYLVQEEKTLSGEELTPAQAVGSLNAVTPHGQRVSGRALMEAGIQIGPIYGDYRAVLVHLQAEFE